MHKLLLAAAIAAFALVGLSACDQGQQPAAPEQPAATPDEPDHSMDDDSSTE